MIRSVLPSLAIIATALLISGCQTPPQPLLIGAVSLNPSLSQSVTQLNVSDNRNHSYLYRIKHDDDKAEFAPPQHPLTDVIKQSLEHLTNATGDESDLSWQISIDEAVIDATIGTVKYELDHNIVLRVEASQGNRRYTNSYRGRLQSEGVGRPDEAVIEREFSQLLQSVLTDIINDSKLRNLN